MKVFSILIVIIIITKSLTPARAATTDIVNSDVSGLLTRWLLLSTPF